MSEAPDDLRYYHLGQGKIKALTLTSNLGNNMVMVTDDFLALTIANWLGLSCQLLLDFAVGRARRGELMGTEARQIVQAVNPRYPADFVPHLLVMLRRF